MKKENKGTLLGIILGLFGLTWLAVKLSNKYNYICPKCIKESG